MRGVVMYGPGDGELKQVTQTDWGGVISVEDWARSGGWWRTVFRSQVARRNITGLAASLAIGSCVSPLDRETRPGS